MNNTKIGSILIKLLDEQKIRVSELARRVNLPQPTVQRIVMGSCANPHMSSLKPIAEFFSISVEQLKGLEPIPKFDKISKVPLINWGDVALDERLPVSEYVLADLPVSNEAYALKVIDGAMDPLFPRDTLLIVDPTIPPKDRSYVIVLLKDSKIPIFRQLVINGPEKLLKPTSPDTSIYKMTSMDDSDSILSTVAQARRNYLD